MSGPIFWPSILKQLKGQKYFLAVFIVLWPYLLTTKLKSVIRHNLGHFNLLNGLLIVGVQNVTLSPFVSEAQGLKEGFIKCKSQMCTLQCKYIKIVESLYDWSFREGGHWSVDAQAITTCDRKGRNCVCGKKIPSWHYLPLTWLHFLTFFPLKKVKTWYKDVIWSSQSEMAWPSPS